MPGEEYQEKGVTERDAILLALFRNLRERSSEIQVKIERWYFNPALNWFMFTFLHSQGNHFSPLTEKTVMNWVFRRHFLFASLLVTLTQVAAVTVSTNANDQDHLDLTYSLTPHENGFGAQITGLDVG